MAYTTSDLVTELAGLEYPVYIGGPVEQNQLYYLHNHAEVEDALQIVPGIYWGGDFSKLTRLLQEGILLLRVFSKFLTIIYGKLR